MEQKHQIFISTINDSAYLSLLEEFKHDNRFKNLDFFEYFTHEVYMVLKKEKDLFPQKNAGIQMGKLELIHILKIQKHVHLLVTKNELENAKGLLILKYLKKFCNFLRNKEITNLYYVPPKNSQNSFLKTNLDYPIIRKFRKYLEIKRYAATTIHTYSASIKYFLSFSNYQHNKQHPNEFWKMNIHQFEMHLTKEVNLEKIATSTAYSYLKAVRLFFCFLSEENQISFRYQIPKRLIQNGKRSNEYVSIQDVLLIIENIFEISKNILRDISIFLIILETGCRPIEIQNLNIDDIYFHEKLIVLKCKKSNQRTLTLTDTTLSFIKQYLQIRENYLPQHNSKALFLTAFGTGTQIRSEHITHLFRKYNLKVFNEIRFTPKTLRHTFITNALNHNINIGQVKESVGHKHLISTHYYFYRDINHMKKLFMDKKFFNGG